MDKEAMEKVVHESSKRALQAMIDIREITSKGLASAEGLTEAMICEMRQKELIWDMEMERYIAASAQLGTPIDKDLFSSCFG